MFARAARMETTDHSVIFPENRRSTFPDHARE
ncbi:hypothetical protein X566_07510 [Afipia sp. P52-10]|jgi:hypothetical protein|nr:hypothetical protein X566_07510 [Afipia sp. P52-10]